MALTTPAQKPRGLSRNIFLSGPWLAEKGLRGIGEDVPRLYQGGLCQTVRYVRMDRGRVRAGSDVAADREPGRHSLDRLRSRPPFRRRARFLPPGAEGRRAAAPRVLRRNASRVFPSARSARDRV